MCFLAAAIVIASAILGAAAILGGSHIVVALIGIIPALIAAGN